MASQSEDKQFGTEGVEMSDKSLYERFGGYDVIVVAVDEILPRLMNDSQLGRFWQNRGRDGIARECQLLIDYLCNAAGGPMYYTIPGSNDPNRNVARACMEKLAAQL